MSKYKILSQTPSHIQSDLFTVNEVQVDVNGEKRTWHNVVVKPTAFVIPITSENEIILISQHRYLENKEELEIVAGFTNDSEDPLVCAKRELIEETGLTANRWKDLGVYGYASSILKTEMHYYIATDLEEGKQNLDDTEDITIVKLPIAEALKKVMDGEIRNFKTMIGIFYASELIREEKL